MHICEYGCGQEAKYLLKFKIVQDKWCCSKNPQFCPTVKEKIRNKLKDIWKDPTGIYNSVLYRKKLSNGVKKSHRDPSSGLNSISRKENLSIAIKKAYKDPTNKLNSFKFTIKKINKKYPFFSKIEEMRYNPDKPDEKEIQVHCKNHNCKNSKEKGGWFTPKYEQLRSRCNALDKEKGNDGHYLYCSQKCKNTCILHGLQNDPYRDTNLPYTQAENNIFNKYILERDNEICYYCGEHANTVHHLRPQKLEPFFTLDPDYAVSCCEKCHYKHGHPIGSKHSTGNLAKIVCSVESQKFLEPKGVQND